MQWKTQRDFGRKWSVNNWGSNTKTHFCLFLNRHFLPRRVLFSILLSKFVSLLTCGQRLHKIIL